MASTRANLVLHPVRLRLLATLARQKLTARQLSALLPDIPQAPLYHHLGMLTRAHLLRVVSERPVRGAVEKRYTLADDAIPLRPADLASASREDHLRYFTNFVAMLLAEYGRYLDRETPIDLFADGVGYRQTPFYLSEDEFAQAAEAINRALLPFVENQPAPHRKRRLLAVITFPVADAPAAPDGAGQSAESLET